MCCSGENCNESFVFGMAEKMYIHIVDVATIPLDTISGLVIDPAGDFAVIMGQLVPFFPTSMQTSLTGTASLSRGRAKADFLLS